MRFHGKTVARLSVTAARLDVPVVPTRPVIHMELDELLATFRAVRTASKRAAERAQDTLGPFRQQALQEQRRADRKAQELRSAIHKRLGKVKGRVQ